MEAITPTLSERGFKQYDKVPSTYGGFIKIYESSSAMAPHIWALIQQPSDLNNPGSPPVEAAAHLTLEDAQHLHDQLGHLIDNHYQRR
jgi:hypothetical protein